MKKKKSYWRDHRDGKLIRDTDAFHTYFAYLAPNRAEAEVWIKEEVDVTDLLEYIQKKNTDDPSFKTTVFHAMLFAIAKTVYHRPILNRFIRNGKYFQRNDLSLSFVAKKKFSDNAEEALVCIKVNEDMNIDAISKKVIGDVQQTRESGTNDADDILKILQKLPGFLLKLVMVGIRTLDRYGKLPSFYYDLDPNFSSVLVSNLGSIKVDAPYHHLNNFGSNSVMMTIGEIHKAARVNENNEVVIRDVVNIGITLDERIGDGYYFSRSVRLFKQIIADPKCLDEPLKTPVEY
ncbi:MAG: 2-oxo acid dehydrogenase subunit E2 [Erysipelotrichaceae bacterium]|nr:2-oxo acid dehydrogenase subunit E2 [Erysipelotrichaceae bacterium]